MSGPVVVVTQYGAEEIAIEPAQVLRYLGMGGRQPDQQTSRMIEDCIGEFQKAAAYKVCRLTAEITVQQDGVDFGVFYAPGQSIVRSLKDCRRAIVFAATTGLQAEQQMKRQWVVSKAKAVVLDAVGTAAAEALCYRFCSDRQAELVEQRLRPRFSPGYGDLPLQLQKELLNCLDSHRKIGLFLSEGLLMTPQKSVWAIMGIGGQGCDALRHDCQNCEKRDCLFRL